MLTLWMIMPKSKKKSYQKLLRQTGWRTQWRSKTFGRLVRWSNLPPYCLRFWKLDSLFNLRQLSVQQICKWYDSIQSHLEDVWLYWLTYTVDGCQVRIWTCRQIFLGDFVWRKLYFGWLTKVVEWLWLSSNCKLILYVC